MLTYNIHSTCCLNTLVSHLAKVETVSPYAKKPKIKKIITSVLVWYHDSALQNSCGVYGLDSSTARRFTIFKGLHTLFLIDLAPKHVSRISG